MSSFKERYQDRFYRVYLMYTALETDLLFFAVVDAMFLTSVKGLSTQQVSQLTFLSIFLSLVVQYPLLKLINRIDTKAAVRAGSIFFLLAAICLTFSPGFPGLLLGGFLECIGYTFNSIGVVVLKNRLEREHREEQYVLYQSDANGVAAFMMMLSALLCSLLFRMNGYFPMYACILLCIAGVAVSFAVTRDENSREEIRPDIDRQNGTSEQKKYYEKMELLIIVSFALLASITGTGLSYLRLNFNELLSDWNPEGVVMLLSVVASLVYLIRMLSNLLLQKIYLTVRNRAMLIVSLLLVTGLLFQLFPWIADTDQTALLLSVGYLMVAFVRDPFTTIIQNLSLMGNEVQRQRKMLIALNGARKASALILSAIATLILKKMNLSAVLLLMTLEAGINLLLSFVILRKLPDINNTRSKNGFYKLEK